MFGIISLTILNVFLFVFSGYLMDKQNKKWMAIILFVLGLTLLWVSFYVVHTTGYGELALPDQGASIQQLDNKEVYCVLGSVPLGSEYVVVLKNREGDTRVYKFKELPPSCFKVVIGENKKMFFEKFPSDK
ncbi:MAG: hypothetical protein QMD65_02655 [Patescibacteria group bacterium]|nr:hypothetical protein [Patescibacteria group bacterium]